MIGWKHRAPRSQAFAVVVACAGVGAAMALGTLRAVLAPPDALPVCASPGTSTYPRLKIMPLGDSITWGTPDPDAGGYRRLLGTLLLRDGYNFVFVGSGRSGTHVVPSPDNEGHPGWTINQIKRGIDSNGWLETYQPDLILLHIGSNDLRPLIGRDATAPGDLSALLDDILTRLPNARVIVAQIIPSRAGPDAVHQAYNASIPRIAASKGARVSVVDMSRILAPSDYADGLHPNASGYDKMARTWERAIRAVAIGRAPREQPPRPRRATGAAAGSERQALSTWG